MCRLFKLGQVAISHGKIIQPFQDTNDIVLDDDIIWKDGQYVHLKGHVYKIAKYLGPNKDGRHGHVVTFVGAYNGL